MTAPEQPYTPARAAGEVRRVGRVEAAVAGILGGCVGRTEFRVVLADGRVLTHTFVDPDEYRGIAAHLSDVLDAAIHSGHEVRLEALNPLGEWVPVVEFPAADAGL